MALFMPSRIIPDVRSGLGLGVVDATQDMTVSWQINGQNALTSFQIAIYTNDSSSTELFTTGEITDGCPAYGTSSTGAIQIFSYTIDAADLATATITNGNEYKLIITQWWNANDSVTQASASVFKTREAPTLSISAIGVSDVISTRYYTFTGNYAQADGDVINWFRWRVAYADADHTILSDTGEISGTMDISCYQDGFFTDTDYSVRLTIQTENGVEADTGWVDFSCAYSVPETSGTITAGCVGGTDAVMIEWGGVGYIPGEASGDYSISDDYILTLPDGSEIVWDQTVSSAMSFAAPWSLVWKGTLGYTDADVFTIGQSGGDITLSYSVSGQSLTLSQGGTTLVSQSGVMNAPTVTAVLTATNLYLRVEYMGGGLYPAATLYPGTSLYPQDDTTSVTNTYTLSPSYTQTAVTSITLGGYQECEYVELIDGTASAATIAAAITNGTYTPGLSESDYMMADWTQGINAGTLAIGSDTLTGFALYRRQGDSAILTKVAETPIETDRVFDYGALSQQGLYTYYLFPVGSTTYISEPLTSGGVMPCWWNWTLMECEETGEDGIFAVTAAYRFRYNVETGAISNNNSPGILTNFTPYPKIQLAPQNYKSSTLTGLIGIVDWSAGQPEYVDTIAWRDAIYALSVTKNPLFLKSRKGDLFRVKIGGAISVQTADATREQTQTVTIPWVEVGSARGVSLYASEFAGVQEGEGAYNPQYYLDVSDATAGALNIRTRKIAYSKDGRVVGDAAVSVSGTTLIMPAGMER